MKPITSDLIDRCAHAYFGEGWDELHEHHRDDVRSATRAALEVAAEYWSEPPEMPSGLTVTDALVDDVAAGIRMVVFQHGTETILRHWAAAPESEKTEYRLEAKAMLYGIVNHVKRARGEK